MTLGNSWFWELKGAHTFQNIDFKKEKCQKQTHESQSMQTFIFFTFQIPVISSNIALQVEQWI